MRKSVRRDAIRLGIVSVSMLLVIILAYDLGFRSGLTHGTDSFSMASVALDRHGVFQPAEAVKPSLFQGDETLEEDFQVFWDAWNLVERDFYGELPSRQDRVYGAVRGMVDSLEDEHTAFLTPREAAILSSDDAGTFEGIGATVQIDEQLGYPRVTQLFVGQPASSAGLLVGDVIVAIDGVSTHEMSILDTVSLIRGPKGSVVRITVDRQREGTLGSFDVEMTRQEIEIPVVETEMLEEVRIAYLRLSEFSTPASERLREGLESLLAQDPRGLILDLRGNPGGYLHVAVEVGSQFVPSGNIVTEMTKDGTENVFEVQPGGLATNSSLPLVVLVDAGSASAAEIVAAAVRDSGRGILIGETTFGKSSVQLPHELGDGSELRVTVARWYAPDGYSIEAGLSPDIEVQATVEDMKEGRDPQRDRAVQYLLGES